MKYAEKLWWANRLLDYKLEDLAKIHWLFNLQDLWDIVGIMRTVEAYY